ncbi:MAG TPA: hypothetical protein VLJ42_09230 [Solirubrobacteraceae bacterium]|nr:hypothetical protein [Solirubrobacteraceae bacterium]
MGTTVWQQLQRDRAKWSRGCGGIGALAYAARLLVVAAAGALALTFAVGSARAANASASAGVIRPFTTIVLPTVTTGGSSGVDSADATLAGTINPDGVEASYHFDYGTDEFYGNSSPQPDTDAGAGSADVAATTTLNGLLANTTYHYRLVGANASGSSVGDDQTFTTAPTPATVDGAPANATNITAAGAMLNGTINAQGSEVTYHFNYGTDNTYGSSTPDADGGSAPGDQPVSADLTGLAPNTTYHFQVVADNGTGGAQAGADQTFTTAPATAAGATDVTAAGATLVGTVNPHGADATLHFDYGATTAYGTSTPTPELDAGSGSADTIVSTPVTGLTPDTTYHVRAVSTDVLTGAATLGVDGTFTTAPGPLAITGDTTGVTPDHATVNGTLNTFGVGGAYRFAVVSTTGTYDAMTGEQPAPAGGAVLAVSAALPDLPPGNTFRVRLQVMSNGATTTGAETTFSTPRRSFTPSAPPPTSASPYGCAAPRLDAYDAHPKPGDTIRISGSDLGVSGAVALGATSLTPTSWGTTGFSITLPADASGTLALTINCGAASNTVAIAIYQAPSNVFSAQAKTRSGTSTLSVRVPGPGTITVRGSGIRATTKHVATAGATTVKATLSAKAARSLKAHHRLAVALKVGFTPTGGIGASKTVQVIFKRKAAH